MRAMVGLSLAFFIASCSCGSATHGRDATVAPVDAEVRDARVADASDAQRVDAPTVDAAVACRPERVRFIPPRRELREGEFCDEAVVCVRDEAEAARVEAAVPSFRCVAESVTTCPGALHCRFERADGTGPGVLDAEAIAALCEVTRLEPPLPTACIAYVR